MKKTFKLSLKKETISELNKKQQMHLKGGRNNEMMYFFGSQFLCVTADVTWDCGGSMSCQGTICGGTVVTSRCPGRC